MHTFLTIDVGNSRTKLRRFALIEGQAPRAVEAADVATDALLADGCDALERTELRELIDGARVLVSSVATRDSTHGLLAALAGAGATLVDSADDAGLELDCRQVHTIGRDRLFAARAAVELTRGSCVVLDAGTALTVDAVRWSGDAQRSDDRRTHVFLGGAIAPGPALLARSLGEGGAQLHDVGAGTSPSTPALGKETAEALRAGVVHGFRGAARELCRRIASEAEFASHAIVLTGGAARILLEPEVALDVGSSSVRVEPELVGLGLLAAAGVDLHTSRTAAR